MIAVEDPFYRQFIQQSGSEPVYKKQRNDTFYTNVHTNSSDFQSILQPNIGNPFFSNNLNQQTTNQHSTLHSTLHSTQRTSRVRGRDDIQDWCDDEEKGDDYESKTLKRYKMVHELNHNLNNELNNQTVNSKRHGDNINNTVFKPKKERLFTHPFNEGDAIFEDGIRNLGYMEPITYHNYHSDEPVYGSELVFL